MAFNPSLPVAGSEIDAVELRAQFNGLRDEVAAIPAGPPGANGADGAPGEVSAADLLNERINHARNPTGVAALGLMVSDPPTQAELQVVAAKLDELIVALRREP